MGSGAAHEREGVDVLRTRIAGIVSLRQELRTSGADRASLEDNRRELVRRQAELGRALIEEHLPNA